jgi:periplasmic protein TonB
MAATDARARFAVYGVVVLVLLAAVGREAHADGITISASDFPFASYLRSVQAKITERWAGKAISGQQPVATFDIARDGRVSALAIEKPSGNQYYDQAALRAITEAAPFPPLPADFPRSAVRVHIGFAFVTEPETGDSAGGSPIVERRAMRVVDAEPGNPRCQVVVQLSDQPSAAWRLAWPTVAIRFGLNRTTIASASMTVTFEVARLGDLPRLLDEALTATNDLVQQQHDRAQRDDRRKREYIDELNRRLR